ncbi:hypothetical protein GCM10009566_42190 [Streptomyces murinus]|uniref:Uncharacterized protein n=1 Tax=Streptomyces murinus TaxID=33900 RepID=A0A7W3NHW2_STRMR|nr:hypothetical protein [Streptomyces murinus]MBA9050830.1 hypothetical protein [Streptomyces murinus]
MASPILTIDTPAGPVRATADPREDDAVVFELGEAMRGSVHVTGTTDPHHWDQFTALRACLGPVNAFKTTAPDEDLTRLARSRTGYHGSLTLYRDHADRPQVSVYPLSTAADYPRRRRRPRYSPPSCAAAPSTSRSAPTCARSWRPPGRATPPACCASSPGPPPTTRPKPSAWSTKPVPRCPRGRPPRPLGGPPHGGSPSPRTRSCC